MSDDKKIQPAMSAEDWRELLAHKYLHLPLNPREEYDLCDRPHSTAATCLYGQPFGFSREDVKECRASARAIEGEWNDYEGAARLESLADRIEALLPPEV